MADRRTLLVVPLLALVLAGGTAYAASVYPDRTRDVTGGPGPDMVSLRLSNTATAIRFDIRFAGAPPLRFSARERWVDMLLIGIDVPPIGPLPSTPGGEWRGVDFALGVHGPSASGRIVRLGVGPRDDRAGTLRIRTTGRTMTFSVPRRALGSPRWFTFSAAAARETESSQGGGIDLAPSRGTFRYDLT